MQLEELIYQLNNDLEITKKIKQEIKTYLEKIQIEGGKDFFVKHTQKMDFFIKLIYKYILKKTFLNYLPSINNIPITIIALGSYGREQLSIYSDIDIMIVYKDIPGYNTKIIIENFITMLWDLGLKIGHRVHEINDLFPASNEDITIKTAILESRYIYGSKFLWYETQNELNKIRNYNKKDFILAKYEEMKLRHKKYPISMEPNIKDGFGGIRDSNTLLWLSKVIFNFPNTSYLVPKYVKEEEFKEYRSALEFLFKTRVFLHLVAKKKIDTVYLEYQRDIALKMGYTDSPRLRAERKFIKDLLKSLWTINTFCEISIKKIIKPYLYKMSFKEAKEKRIKKYFYKCDNKLYSTFKTSLSFKEYLNNILEIENFNNTDISTIYNLKSKKNNITKTLTKKLFYNKNIYPIFMALYRANKLEKIIPPFEKVKYLAQFDGYHQYPVDIHSLYTLKELETIKEFNELEEKEKAILRFASFFHDLGKGRLEDHSIVGAKIAKEFAKNINFPGIDIIEKLIKHHTLMSNVAQREDIFNDKVILSFAEIVKDESFLKYLYILTIADIKAVGKGVFNSYKEYLLKTLYQNTLQALNNKELINEITIRKRKEKMISSKEEFKNLPKKLQKELFKSPSNQLFLQNSINSIIEILEWIKDIEDFKIKFENDKHLIIHIAKKNNLNISLGWLLEKLQNYNLNHLSIYKIGEIKYFKILFEKKANEYDLELIRKYIIDSFDKKEIKNKIVFKKDNFTIDCNHSPNYAALKLKTKDKKGIISTIMDVLDKFEVNVEDVKISSQKNIARDLFIISKDSGFCEKKDEILKALTK
ncbi:HD domain-containing protein [Caminibacter mediatlanticus]|uniref:Bifunctional uridylyltransferase/uridylyl-removing enzyme n=1 Tax=Caminibacter mediatlanticus TB-2 TaxID=391592 RepID=A0AAI9F2K4_9BACT|nr:HD domain-containing protein [Caminibacter mediatlanticus]EDM23899.1 metal dependent phosphohydrolase [Caminibacter mediatlanticus TB-2]